MAKKITVKDVLNLMAEKTPVCVQLFAYGVPYGQTTADGMKTAADCIENMNTHCLNALVGSIRLGTEATPTNVVITAEIVH